MSKRQYRDCLIDQIVALQPTKSIQRRFRYQLEAALIPELERLLSKSQEKYAPRSNLLDQRRCDELVLTYTTLGCDEVFCKAQVDSTERENYERVASALAEQLVAPMRLFSVKWFVMNGGELKQRGGYNKDWRRLNK